MSFVRITGVHTTADKKCRVAYFEGDRENEIVWHSEPPATGDVYELIAGLPPRKIASAQSIAWTPTNDALRWRKPISANAPSRMEILKRRHSIRQAVRAYLDEQQFIEIEAPLLVHGASPELAIHSFPVGERYLVSSTEYQMKRLAVGGFERIYSLTKNFRVEDVTGTCRNSEFSMLEWGRVGQTMRPIEQDAEALTRRAMKALGLPDILTYQGHKIDMSLPWERLSVAAVIERYTGVRMETFDAAACRKAAEASGLAIKPEWAEQRAFLFSLLMDHLQPHLGAERPLFLCDWPSFQTTSAKTQEDANLVERSELFIAGLEIADGFAAMADADMQAQSFEMALQTRRVENLPEVALDQNYLDALRLGAPYGAGMALGFDRLVMLLTNQAEIRNVCAFAWDEV